MPPKMLFDVSTLDTSKVLADRDAVYRILPHRFEFMRLSGIYQCDHSAGLIVGFHDLTSEEFWIRGHIPGRPIFPGVMMIETAAQLVSYYVMSDPASPKGGFLGFGGVESVKFRGSVSPGKKVIMVGSMVENRPRRCVGATQAFVDGQMVYEGIITGMWI